MSIASHELALYEINTGSRYKRRCAIASYPPVSRATNMLDIARDAARDYAKDFASPGDMIFTATDLLECAIELIEYYEQHVAETGALEANDSPK